MTMSVALTNLGQYNEGILNFTWLELPASDEEIAEAYDKISVSYGDNHHYGSWGQEYEEVFITDYECEFMEVDEYANLEELNEIAETIEGLTESEAEIVEALMNDGYNLEEAIDKKDDCIYWDNCDSMTEVAERYAEETGMLDQIPESLRYYFDFESFGRDLSFDGHWIATDTGYIEVL